MWTRETFTWRRTSHEAECVFYHKVMLMEPFWEVTPIMVCGYMVVTLTISASFTLLLLYCSNILYCEYNNNNKCLSYLLLLLHCDNNVISVRLI